MNHVDPTSLEVITTNTPASDPNENLFEADEFFDGDEYTRANSLEEVLALLDPVIASLNDSHSQCHECGHKRYKAWTESQIKQHLSGARGRIAKALAEIKKQDIDQEC